MDLELRSVLSAFVGKIIGHIIIGLIEIHHFLTQGWIRLIYFWRFLAIAELEMLVE